MKKTIILAAIVLAAPSVGANAKAPSSRAQVFASVTREAKTDTITRVNPAKVNASISQVDLNGDGMPDYAVDYQKLESPAWCGTGGCRYQLWLSQRDAAPKLVFDRHKAGLSVRRWKSGTVFDFDFHGVVCGGTGSDPCQISFAFNAKSQSPAVVPSPGQRRIRHRTQAIDRK